MDIAILWIIVFGVIALIFLIILLLLKYFKEFFKKINLFLIFKRKKKDIGQEIDGPSGDVLIAKEQKEEKRGGKLVVTEEEKRRLSQKYKNNSNTVSGTSSTKKKFSIKEDGLEDLLRKLKDKEIVYMLDYLRKENHSLMEKLFLGKTFESEDELKGYLKEETARFLDSEVTLLKSRVSDLRKKGLDVEDIDYKIMPLPFKIRLLVSNFNTKDFERIIASIRKISAELKKVELAEEASKKQETKSEG